jgi:hypothetical protein
MKKSTYKFRKLISNRRGVNAVISSVILAGAVIALGFVALYYTQQKAMESNIQYANNTNDNIASVQEKLSFLHIDYNISINELTVYLMNNGKSDDIGIAKIYLNNDSWIQSFDDLELKFLNGTVMRARAKV